MLNNKNLDKALEILDPITWEEGEDKYQLRYTGAGWSKALYAKDNDVMTWVTVHVYTDHEAECIIRDAITKELDKRVITVEPYGTFFKVLNKLDHSLDENGAFSDSNYYKPFKTRDDASIEALIAGENNGRIE